MSILESVSHRSDDEKDLLTQGAIMLRDFAQLQTKHSEAIDYITAVARQLHRVRFGNTVAHQVMFDIDMCVMLDNFQEGLNREPR